MNKVPPTAIVICQKESQNLVYMPVNAFLPPAADPAGITFNTLNLTVFDRGLRERKMAGIHSIHNFKYFGNIKKIRSHYSETKRMLKWFSEMNVNKPALSNDDMVAFLHTETR